LYYWLVLLFIGTMRWIFVDAAFTLNVFPLVLLALAVMFTLRMICWMRNGLLN
jgi:hypothetical protein